MLNTHGSQVMSNLRALPKVRLITVLGTFLDFVTISNGPLRHRPQSLKPHCKNSKACINWYRSLGGRSSRSSHDECVTAMKHLHHPCGLASVMQATSRRQRHADPAKRTCCRKPAVIGENVSSSAAHKQRKSSTTVLKQLSKVITNFGNKKAQFSENTSPASIVRETAQASRCKPTGDFLVDVNASAYGLEGPEALREQPAAARYSLLQSNQGLNHEAFAHASCILDPTGSSACPTQLPSLADDRISPAAIQQQERDQGKVRTDLRNTLHTVQHVMLRSAFVIPCSFISASHMPALRFAALFALGLLVH